MSRRTYAVQMMALSQFVRHYDQSFKLVYTDDDTFFRSTSGAIVSFAEMVRVYNESSSTHKMFSAGVGGEANIYVPKLSLFLHNNSIEVAVDNLNFTNDRGRSCTSSTETFFILQLALRANRLY